MSKKSRTKKINPVKKMTSSVGQTVSHKAKKIEPETVAKGAAAVSIAAGMIAAGAALMDKENRRKVGKTAYKGMEFLQGMAATATEEAQGRYQAVHMTVPLKAGQSKGRSSKKQSRGRSKSK